MDDLTSRTFAAVLFDNDGTLIDSTGSVERSWGRWGVEHGVDVEALRHMHGRPAADIIRELAPDADHESTLRRITDLEIADLDGVVALPGSHDATEALAGPPELYAIATSATRDLADARLHAAGIRVPAALVTYDDVDHGKPHPEPYLLAAERLGVDPADCLVCEDAPNGIRAARAAGAAVLAITTTSPREDLDGDLVVGSLAEVTFQVEDGRVHVSTR